MTQHHAAAPGAAGSVGDGQSAFLEAVQDRLLGFLNEQERVLTAVSPETEPLIAAIRDLSAGGKRLRALLLLWGWRAAGGAAQDPRPVQAGAAIELFQSAALIHDDIIDHSDTRRGRPSVHQRFAAAHRERGWFLEARDYGLMGGILAGDLCLSFSEALFAPLCAGADPAATTGPARARAIFDLMRTEVMAGQYLDGLSEHLGLEEPEAALERALRVIRYKAAKYTCEHPLLIGASLAGGEDALLSSLSEVGLPLGEAFQLRDDVLGVFGEPAVTGKPAGDDLREGKRTVLVALAHAGADAQQSRELEAGLGDPRLTQDGVHRLREILRATGALGRTEELIREREQRARKALDRLEVDSEVRAGLERLSERALHRSS
ncbi:polyprenyl synthetase family protein [Rothia kristinae]|uniref:polyprenyl synthetase family protein n=1 Tax=Rothia kristinae TaxID=37923 RepID=UPI00119E74B7|nr:polyprenyl synthetase family protein [Rothia kristinae]